jgi:hypothetical protein
MNRDQWSGQGSVTNRGNFGNLSGFDEGNFSDDNMQTAKYQSGRIFSRYDPNDPGVSQKIAADAEFRAQFPNARFVGPDKIDYGDGRPVDYIIGHGAPGAMFGWQTDDGGVGGPNSARMAGLPTPGLGSESDLMAMILESLQTAQPDPQELLQAQFRI